MKKIILYALLIALIATTPTVAQTVTGCGTLMQGPECAWFEFQGQNYGLILQDGMTMPTGTSEFYIEGTIKLSCVELWCPFPQFVNCIELSFISACDACPDEIVGDLNNDSAVNIDDLSFLTAYLTGRGIAPSILGSADLNGDCVLDFNDIIYLEDFLFSQGNRPVDCYCTDPDTCSLQMPGDITSDGLINVEDLSFLTAFLSGVGEHPQILANADPNGDCIIDDNDIQYMSDFFFAGGSQPVDCTCLSPDTCSFQMPGDVTNNGLINVEDLSFLTAFLSGVGEHPQILANADPNGDCIIDENDIQYMSDFFFEGGSQPVDCTCVNPVIGQSVCCFDIRGNFDYDPADKIDVSDLVGMVEYMFQGGAEPICFDEADVDASTQINITDLVYFVAFMFSDGPSPEPCQ